MADERRLVFYEDDIEAIQRALVEALRAAALRFAMLGHVEGYPIVVEATESAGHVGDPETLAALFAAGFAACREPRKVLDPEPLEEVRLRTGGRCLLLTSFSDVLLLAVEYDLARSTQEKVDAEVRRAIEHVGAVVEAIRRRPPHAEPLEDMDGAPARLRPSDPPRRPPPAPGSSAQAPPSS